MDMLGRFRHWTPGYVGARLRQMVWQRRNPQAPWLTASMVAILEDWLQETDLVFEWGSGRSTRWLAQRVAHVSSVEENEAWLNRVRNWLKADGNMEKVTLFHRETVEKVRQAYVMAIHEVPETAFDCILVDGDHRDHCAIEAVNRVAPGGALVIDNVERYIPRAQPSPAPNARHLGDGYASSL